MIAYVRGILTERNEETVVVEAGGIGYEIAVPLTVLERLPAVGSEILLYTYHLVREDAQLLYGFLRREERETFRCLLTVSGVGPKGALGILSALPVDQLRFAILAEDVKKISAAPGIGPKTAKKLILELKDKFHLEDVFEESLASDPAAVGQTESTGARRDAIEALTALGYSAADAARAVSQVPMEEDTTVETILKQALRFI